MLNNILLSTIMLFITLLLIFTYMAYKTEEQRKNYNRKWYKDNTEKQKDYQRRWQRDNPEKQRCRRLKSEYGITVEQHRQMFIDQNGRCAICNKLFDNRKDICVDHNHTNHQVRQLLCKKCNILLGHIENNTSLSNAIEYLNKWNE